MLGLSTIYTVHEVSSHITHFQKYSQTISTNTATARKVFGNLSRVELDIPTFIDDYNHNMNGINLVNQFWEAYDIQ